MVPCLYVDIDIYVSYISCTYTFSSGSTAVSGTKTHPPPKKTCNARLDSYRNRNRNMNTINHIYIYVHI